MSNNGLKMPRRDSSSYSVDAFIISGLFSLNRYRFWIVYCSSNCVNCCRVMILSCAGIFAQEVLEQVLHGLSYSYCVEFASLNPHLHIFLYSAPPECKVESEVFTWATAKQEELLVNETSNDRRPAVLLSLERRLMDMYILPVLT